MPKHLEKKYLPYTPLQMYRLVADIEHYPDFLPWVHAVRVLDIDGNITTAEMVVKFKAFREKFTSRVAFDPPEEEYAEGGIKVSLVEGPFHFLENNWKFIPADNGGTLVEFHIDFRFKSRILEKLIGTLFENALRKMMNAFEDIAKKKYAGKLSNN